MVSLFWKSLFCSPWNSRFAPLEYTTNLDLVLHLDALVGLWPREHTKRQWEDLRRVVVWLGNEQDEWPWQQSVDGGKGLRMSQKKMRRRLRKSRRKTTWAWTPSSPYYGTLRARGPHNCSVTSIMREGSCFYFYHPFLLIHFTGSCWSLSYVNNTRCSAAIRWTDTVALQTGSCYSECEYWVNTCYGRNTLSFKPWHSPEKSRKGAFYEYQWEAVNWDNNRTFRPVFFHIRFIADGCTKGRRYSSY